MNFYFLIFSILFAFFLNISFAAKNVAKVKMMRGTAAIKRGGKPVEVKKGMWVVEGDEITTQKKSFVRLLYTDRSVMNLGPESEMKIEKFGGKKAGLVKLIKGQLRSKVTKDVLSNSKKSKLFIKTKTAAMGVRGTDFHITEIPGQRTSLVTYEGEVAMVQTKPDQEISYGRLDRALRSDQAVSVKQGQFAGTDPQKGRVNVPVKVAPAQLGALRKNETFAEASSDSNKKVYKSPVPPGVSSKAVMNTSIDKELKSMAGDAVKAGGPPGSQPGAPGGAGPLAGGAGPGGSANGGPGNDKAPGDGPGGPNPAGPNQAGPGIGADGPGRDITAAGGPDGPPPPGGPEGPGFIAGGPGGPDDGPPPEGLADKETGAFAPPAGGPIDLKTGIYIPPPPGSTFDPNTGTYNLPPNFGGIDPATGSYVPPAGLVLTDTGAFVTEADAQKMEIAEQQQQQRQAGPNGPPPPGGAPGARPGSGPGAGPNGPPPPGGPNAGPNGVPAAGPGNTAGAPGTFAGGPGAPPPPGGEFGPGMPPPPGGEFGPGAPPPGADFGPGAIGGDEPKAVFFIPPPDVIPEEPTTFDMPDFGPVVAPDGTYAYAPPGAGPHGPGPHGPGHHGPGPHGPGPGGPDDFRGPGSDDPFGPPQDDFGIDDTIGDIDICALDPCACGDPSCVDQNDIPTETGPGVSDVIIRLKY